MSVENWKNYKLVSLKIIGIEKWDVVENASCAYYHWVG